MKGLVPTLEDLRKDKIDGLDAYNLLINQEPPIGNIELSRQGIEWLKDLQTFTISELENE